MVPTMVQSRSNCLPPVLKLVVEKFEELDPQFELTSSNHEEVQFKLEGNIGSCRLESLVQHNLIQGFAHRILNWFWVDYHVAFVTHVLVDEEECEWGRLTGGFSYRSRYDKLEKLILINSTTKLLHLLHNIDSTRRFLLQFPTILLLV